MLCSHHIRRGGGVLHASAANASCKSTNLVAKLLALALHVGALMLALC